MDNHLIRSPFVKPYSTQGPPMTATQTYSYICSCANNNGEPYATAPFIVNLCRGDVLVIEAVLHGLDQRNRGRLETSPAHLSQMRAKPNQCAPTRINRWAGTCFSNCLFCSYASCWCSCSISRITIIGDHRTSSDSRYWLRAWPGAATQCCSPKDRFELRGEKSPCSVEQ